MANPTQQQSPTGKPEAAKPKNGDVSQRQPVLIGISGKVDFLKNPGRNEAVAALNADYLQAFKDRFDDFAGWLDDLMLPSTPKILLCGGAAGVDLAAMETALARPKWSVVIVLPFVEAQYKKSFADPKDWDRLTALRAHPKVKTITLPNLRQEDFDDRDFLDDGKMPLPVPDALIDPDLKDGAHRQRQYEQLALWLARSSTIFIASMLASVPGKPQQTTATITLENGEPKGASAGGTPRALALRRSGIPDEYAEQVILRSTELQTSSVLEEPDGGYALLLDPSECSHKFIAGYPQLRPLAPLQELVNHREGTEASKQLRLRIYDSPAAPHEAENPARAWKNAMAVAQSFESLNKTVEIAKHPVEAPLFSNLPPASFLEKIRGGDCPISKTQSACDINAKRSLTAMLYVSVGGSFLYASYSEWFQEAGFFLLAYIAAILAVVGIALVASWRSWWIISQDLRGLKEVMRVQIAWWQAGIDYMVDRVHLRGIDSDLRMVRERAAAVSLWAKLQWQGYQPGRLLDEAEQDEKQLYARIRDEVGGKWIDSQTNYFKTSAVQQLGYLLWAERLASIALVATVLVLLSIFTAGYFSDGPRWVTVPGLVIIGMVLTYPPLAQYCADLRCRLCGCFRDSLERPTRAHGEQKKYHDRSQGRFRVGTSAAVLELSGLLICAALSLQMLWLGALPGFWFSDENRRLVTFLPPALIFAGVVLHHWAYFDCMSVATGCRSDRDRPERMKYITEAFLPPLWQGVMVALFVNLAIRLLADATHPAGSPLAFLNPAGFTSEQLVAHLLSQSAVMLLVVTAAIKVLVERRNFSAQAASYDDSFRAFSRAREHLDRLLARWENAVTQNGAIPRRELSLFVRDLGELALEEEEAWLKAHRQRPPRPVVG